MVVRDGLDGERSLFLSSVIDKVIHMVDSEKVSVSFIPYHLLPNSPAKY